MIRCLLLISLLIHSTLAAPLVPPPKKWLTLNGQEPIVVARGGFTGLFPESSSYANEMAISQSLQGSSALLCNLQLTKDSVGICLSGLQLDNTTTISQLYPEGKKNYNVNGKEIRGYFALDFTVPQLDKVALIQNTFSRPNGFDGYFPIATVEDVLGSKPEMFWLSVPYVEFYNQNKISIAAYVEKAMARPVINYLSSPEIGFLKSMSGKANKKTKIIFQFLKGDETEPTTKLKYSELVKDLGMIKSFAAGILVPKEYIWPINKDHFLEAATTLVTDAHKQGLEVYASGFSNDDVISYNYTFDPTAEYQQFIDNSQFAVDGVLTDFPPTASEAIACFAQSNNDTKPYKGSPLIITRNGASGIYPGSTDLAYKQAVDDGADIIDCSVQISSDGVAFCLDTIDLNSGTNAVNLFITKSGTILELQPKAGIFSFQLSWSEIQTLKPQLQSPYGTTTEMVFRNPANKNAGKLVTLSEFLDIAKKKAVTGILINIENAAYLASKQGLDIVGAVTSALSNATFDKQSTQQVLIKSDDTSVLSKFIHVPNYKRVLNIKETISGAPKKAVAKIKKFADTVVVNKESLVRTNQYSFISGETKVVKQMQAANISVYVHWLKNEYNSLMFDYMSDPMLEIATYAQGFKVDGIITDFPGTASKYLRSPCADMDPKADNPFPITPIQPNSLFSLIDPEAVAAAEAPSPPLNVSNIVDPPLPAVVKKEPSPDSGSNSDSKSDSDSNSNSNSNSPPAPAPSGTSNAFSNAVSWGLSLLPMVLLTLLSILN